MKKPMFTIQSMHIYLHMYLNRDLHTLLPRELFQYVTLTNDSMVVGCSHVGTTAEIANIHVLLGRSRDFEITKEIDQTYSYFDGWVIQIEIEPQPPYRGGDRSREIG